MRGEEKKENLQPQLCPACEGKSISCKVCAGNGRVMVMNGITFAWKKKITRLGIEVDEWEEKVRVQIGMAALLMAVGGLSALASMAYVADSAGTLRQKLITGSDAFTLSVWVGTLACSYFIYHVLHRTLSLPTVKRLMTGKKGKRWGKRAPASRDIAQAFSPPALHIVEHAYLLASRLGTHSASAIHLFASAVTDPTVGLMISRFAVDGKKLIEKIKHVLSRRELHDHDAPHLDVHWHDALLRSFAVAAECGHRQVDATDLAVSLSNPLCVEVTEVLTDLYITEQKIWHVAEWIDLHRTLVRRSRHLRGRAAYKPKGAMNRTYTSIATPLLDSFSRNLTARAQAGAMPLVVGREREVAEIFRLFSAGERGVLLVGEEGAGKSALIGQIAQAMVAEDVPEIMKDKRCIELSVPALIAGGDVQGGIEGALLKMGREIRRAGNVILAIENVHTLVGTKSSGGEAFDVSGVLAELLEQKALRVIATTTPTEARSFIENSPLARLLERVDVGETDREQTIRVLESKAPFLESRFKVYYSYPAIERVVDLSLRYINVGHLPDKAIRLMEETGEAVREERGVHALVTPEDAAGVVSEKMQIPLTNISEEESSVLLHFEERLHERIIGQDDAVRLVAQAIRRGRVELRDRKRPIASFLFLGPTGVGKTEVARAVASLYFGDEKTMVRLDMSEYQGPDALGKLLGSPIAGSFGYLTEAVRQKQFSLVLLDEFEKASGEVLNLFLQVLEDGRLTDASGRTVDFSNTIIIATSNVAAGVILDAIRAGETIEKIRAKVMQVELPRLLKPELLNRFDGVVVFAPLKIEEVQEIVRLLLARVERDLNEKGVALKAEEVAVHDLAREGFDPAWGARPLRRLIQERIEDPIAKFILSGQLQRRDVVILGYHGEPKVEKAPPL